MAQVLFLRPRILFNPLMRQGLLTAPGMFRAFPPKKTMPCWNFWKKITQDRLALFHKPAIELKYTGDIPPVMPFPDLPETSISAQQFATASTSSAKSFSRPSQCQKCGACCAFFRVRFPASESNSCLGGSVPIDLTVLLDDATRCMQGTETTNPRCIALHGQVGTNVSCSIYLCRPSCCRNFLQSWKNEAGNTLCDRARAVFGLQPFSQY
jgi:uncharacterized protein